MKLEIEKTFKFSNREKNKLLNVLKLSEGNFDGVILKKKKISYALHLIVADKNLNLKKRIKIVFINAKKRKLQILYAPKMRISDIQNNIQMYLEEHMIVDEGAAFFPLKINIGAMYLKKRTKFIYKLKERKWVVGVDEIWVINPWKKKQSNKAYCYMEIEGGSEEEIDYLLNLLLSNFKDNLQLLDSDESKIKIVSEYEIRGKHLQFQELSSLEAFSWKIYDKWIKEFGN